MSEREHKQGEQQSEGDANSQLSRESVAELSPRTLRSWPELKAQAFNWLSHPGVPIWEEFCMLFLSDKILNPNKTQFFSFFFKFESLIFSHAALNTTQNKRS